MNLALFALCVLHSGVGIFGGVTGAALEEVVIRLDIGCEVDNFTGFKLLDGVENNLSAVMVGAFVVTRQTDAADVFAALGCVSRGTSSSGKMAA